MQTFAPLVCFPAARTDQLMFKNRGHKLCKLKRLFTGQWLR